MHKVFLVAGAVYNQCMIYYLRNNASCDNSVATFYVKFRQSALYGCYVMFLLFLIALARSCNEKPKGGGSSTVDDPPSVVALLFVALLLGYNITLLVYLYHTKDCGAKVGTTNATIGKGLIVITCLFIVVDLVLLIKGIHERRQEAQRKNISNQENESR